MFELCMNVCLKYLEMFLTPKHWSLDQIEGKAKRNKIKENKNRGIHMTMVTYANFIQNNIYLCLECLQTLINPKQHSLNKIKIKKEK